MNKYNILLINIKHELMGLLSVTKGLSFVKVTCLKWHSHVPFTN